MTNIIDNKNTHYIFIKSFQNKNDRAYLLQIDGRYQEVKMAAVLVNGLIQLNRVENRNDASLDTSFIEALIIGLCTRKSVMSPSFQIQKDLLIFMRGLFCTFLCWFIESLMYFFIFLELFLIRIDGLDPNGRRYLSFGALVDIALEKIRKN